MKQLSELADEHEEDDSAEDVPFKEQIKPRTVYSDFEKDERTKMKFEMLTNRFNANVKRLSLRDFTAHYCLFIY